MENTSKNQLYGDLQTSMLFIVGNQIFAQLRLKGLLDFDSISSAAERPI